MTLTRKWLLGGIAVVILVFLVGYFLIVSPARNTAAATWQQVEDTNAANARLQSDIARLEQQSTEIPAKLDEIASYDQKMPAEMKQPELIRAIEGAAQSAGVDLTGIAPAEPTELEGTETRIVALPVSLTALGRYANIKTFVDNLEQLDRAFLIQTIDVSAGEAADEFNLTLGGSFFTLPDGDLKAAEPTTPSPTASAPAPTAAAAAKAPAAAHKKADGKKDAAKGRHASDNQHKDNKGH